MSLYIFEIAIPATLLATEKTVRITETDNAVQRVEVELRKEKKSLSHLSVSMFDPNFSLLSRLPDPAYADVPVKFSMTDGVSAQPVTVFEGIVSRYAFGYPEDMIEIVAQDKAVKMRREARIKRYSSLTPVQLAQTLAKEYGLEVDADHGNVVLPQFSGLLNLGAIGTEAVSDWDFMVSTLHKVGLTVHMKGKKIVIRQQPTQLYPTTFKPGDLNVVKLNGSINHVKSPGGQGDVTTTNPAFNNDQTVKALKGKDKRDAEKQSGGASSTSRRLAGPHKDTTGPHVEDAKAGKYTDIVTHRKGRKDDATLIVNAAPGITLDHLVRLDGFAGKIDGEWEVTTVKHVLFGEGEATSTLSLARGTSKGTGKQSGTVAFEYTGVKA